MRDQYVVFIVLFAQPNDSKVYRESQESQNSQQNIEGKGKGWRFEATRLQDLIGSYSGQESVMLEQNRQPEIDIHDWSQLISDRLVFTTGGVGACWNNCISTWTKNESRYKLYTLHKNWLKMNHRSKCKIQNYKSHRK